jgi:solute carrier family 25 iron transporter 28/37
MQASSSRSSHLSEVFYKIFETEGFLRLWRGVSSVVLGCVPAHAAYFSIYEMGKRKFNIESNNEMYLFSTMLTGGMATISHDFIMTPMDGT